MFEDKVAGAAREIYEPERAQRVQEALLAAGMTMGHHTMLAPLVRQVNLENGAGSEIEQGVRIEVAEPNSGVREMVLKTGPHAVGRLPSSDVFIDQCQVSRIQAEIVVHSGGRVTVRDLASKNGTELNGVKLRGKEKRRLEQGDTLTFGSFAKIRILAGAMAK